MGYRAELPFNGPRFLLGSPIDPIMANGTNGKRIDKKKTGELYEVLQYQKHLRDSLTYLFYVADVAIDLDASFFCRSSHPQHASIFHGFEDAQRSSVCASRSSSHYTSQWKLPRHYRLLQTTLVRRDICHVRPVLLRPVEVLLTHRMNLCSIDPLSVAGLTWMFPWKVTLRIVSTMLASPCITTNSTRVCLELLMVSFDVIVDRDVVLSSMCRKRYSSGHEEDKEGYSMISRDCNRCLSIWVVNYLLRFLTNHIHHCLAHSTMKRCRSEVASPQHDLQKVVESQASEISSLKHEKTNIESSLNTLRSEHERVVNENRILKKAVTIQQERQNQAMSEIEAARQYKYDAEDRIRKLEQIILSLRYHLQTQHSMPTNDFMGFPPRPPDVY